MFYIRNFMFMMFYTYKVYKKVYKNIFYNVINMFITFYTL